jgi:virulence-associated protein VagC
VREGQRRVIVPSNAVWDDFFDSPGIDLAPQIRADESLYPKEYTD